jgi:hypothetical protein
MTQPVHGALAQGGLRILLLLLLVQSPTAQTCGNNRNSCANSMKNCSDTLNSCGAGTYSFDGCSSNTIYQCICCPTGSNSTVGTTSVTGCTCNAGFGGNAATGSPTCCTACAAGTYKVASGNTACTTCPAYATTASIGSTTISACTCNADYGGNANTSAGCTACAPGFYKPSSGNVECISRLTNTTNPPGQGVDLLAIFLCISAIVLEIRKWYAVKKWSDLRKEQYKKEGCKVCGCVLWYDMSATKQWDFRYNFLTSAVLSVLSISKATTSNASAVNAAKVNAILTIFAFFFELYDCKMLHFKSTDDESEINTTRFLLICKIFGILLTFASLIYDSVKSAASASSDGWVYILVAVAFILSFMILFLEGCTLYNILQKSHQTDQLHLSGCLGFGPAYSGARCTRPPHSSSLSPSLTLSRTPLNLSHTPSLIHSLTRSLTHSHIQVV